jgi:hypothetical protein
VKARQVEDVANGDALLWQIRDLQRRTLAILTDAEAEDGDKRVALVAIHQARENLVLLAKLTAELSKPTDEDVRARAVMLAARIGVSADELLELAERIAAPDFDPETFPALPAAPALAAPAPVVTANGANDKSAAPTAAPVASEPAATPRPWHMTVTL